MSPTTAVDIIEKYFTCEFSTLSRDGTPVTWPVSPRLLADGRFLLTTSIGLPQKAFNIRRNPKVSLLFSEPPGAVSTHQGPCSSRAMRPPKTVVTDMSSDPDLDALAVTITGRQPAGAFWSTWLGRRLMWPYYIRASSSM